MNNQFLSRSSSLLIIVLGLFLLADGFLLRPLSKHFGRQKTITLSYTYTTRDTTAASPNRVPTKVNITCDIAWATKTCTDTSFGAPSDAVAWINKKAEVSLNRYETSTELSENLGVKTFTVTNRAEYKVLMAK